MYETPLTGLVLTGGGARAAYQFGVLRAIARLRRESGTDPRRNPLCGDLRHLGGGHQFGRTGLPQR